MLVIGAVVLVLALVIGYAVTRSSNKPQAGSDIPLDILAMNASQLRFRRSQKWNEHQQRPAIQNRIPGGGYQPERARRVYGYLHPA